MNTFTILYDILFFSVIIKYFLIFVMKMTVNDVNVHCSFNYMISLLAGLFSVDSI